MKYKTLIWWAVFLSAALPSAYLILMILFFPRRLGVDPIEVFLQETGIWALRFLLISLACSPIRRIGVKWIVQFRRMFGLYAFYYASLHLSTYIGGWIEFDWALLTDDLVKRPFIYIGMLTWLILLILALTSPKWVVKRLKRKWVLIHKAVFLAVCAAWLHLWMQSRASAAESLLYLMLIALLLGERLYRYRSKTRLVKAKT